MSHGMGQRRFEPIPPGWFDCPPIGAVSKEHHLIPMKVGDASAVTLLLQLNMFTAALAESSVSWPRALQPEDRLLLLNTNSPHLLVPSQSTALVCRGQSTWCFLLWLFRCPWDALKGVPTC